MKIYELIDSSGQINKYQSFRVKPTQEDFVRVSHIPRNPNTLPRNRKNTFRHLSLEKVYEVYRVVNTNQVLIKDDQGELALLTPSYFEVVEEISGREFELLKKNNEMLLLINNMIKN